MCSFQGHSEIELRRLHRDGNEFTTSKIMTSRICAFTLIKLLIVVSIIAILAAIAVPSFLEA